MPSPASQGAGPHPSDTVHRIRTRKEQPLALLWHQQDTTTRYEVRSAGNSRRLYTNGVLHSQYNSRQPLTGSVWDLLTLPAFFTPQSAQRILMLGVGGGAVIRQLNHFLTPQCIVGVELDRVHLAIAQRYFDVAAPNVQLHQADALRWVKTYRGAPFNIIVDDLFGDADGEPQRVVTADSSWFLQLGELLAPGGVLVANFASLQELKSCAWFRNARMRNRYPSAFAFTAPSFANAIGAFLRTPADSAQLRRHLMGVPALARALRNGRLNYRIRRLRVP